MSKIGRENTNEGYLMYIKTVSNFKNNKNKIEYYRHKNVNIAQLMKNSKNALSPVKYGDLPINEVYNV